MTTDNLRKETKIESLDLNEYLDFKSFSERYPQFKPNQLRWYVVRKDELGLTPAIRKLGRRLYFHVPTFLKWVESQNA